MVIRVTGVRLRPLGSRVKEGRGEGGRERKTRKTRKRRRVEEKGWGNKETGSAGFEGVKSLKMSNMTVRQKFI